MTAAVHLSVDETEFVGADFGEGVAVEGHGRRVLPDVPASDCANRCVAGQHDAPECVELPVGMVVHDRALAVNAAAADCEEFGP